MEIGRYYLSRGFYTAAINRFRVVVEDYQTTTQTPEALHRLVEAYLSLGLDQRGADRRSDPRLQLPGLARGTRTATRCFRARPAAGQRRRQLAEPDLPPGGEGKWR